MADDADRRDEEVTGPVPTQHEAESLASLMRDPSWQVFHEYLDRIIARAKPKHMRLNQNQETAGYYKGVQNVCEDIQDLPEAIARQVFPAKEETKNQGGLE
ncbi:hypothetical protein LCGC14_0384420 [marine sediment metagenome]|uniref:Uncharacterized protein n=1 Tax=marine sediment metagenome TaxID=412755 RepID=A0A0F9WAB0_9ZZZZ